MLLLGACGTDTDEQATLDAGCIGLVPTGCQCVAGVQLCGPSAGDSATPEAGVVMVGDGGTSTQPVITAEAGTSTSEAGLTPRLDAGNAATGDAALPEASVVVDAGSRDADKPVVDAAPDTGTPNKATGFVGEHGALQVKGNRVVDQSGKPLQLRGMSLFWSQWTDFYVAKNVDVLVDDWKATVVRAALGVENDGGYLMDAQANVAKVRAIVDRAIARGIYVIIDWHDHNAQNHVTQATAFFQEMARTYGKQPHVIFEVFNEPLQVPWSSVKSYAEGMVRTIRDAGSTNLIIVGTPSWSQDVDSAASDRLSDTNVAYTLHFYANTHKQSLRDKAKTALDRGAALFVTEWGTCSADGNGSINEAETRTWLDFLKSNSISWANWALNNKAEACSAVQASGAGTGPWREDQLTASGKLVKSLIP